jgi:hypothetical protein
LRLDEDAPVVMARAAMAVADAGGTCKITIRWVSSTNAGMILIPFLFGQKLLARGGAA